MSEIESIIRDLLHPTIEIRKKALSEIEKYWSIEKGKDLRPYLWKAIEEEKNKTFQAEIVDLAIRKLKDKSLRKMIRLIENDFLMKPARNLVISAYTIYETSEIRKTLIQSLKRDKSKTYIFVEELLRSKDLENMENVKVIELLNELLLDETILDHLRIRFSEIMTKKKSSPLSLHQKPYYGDFFIRQYNKNPIIRLGILNAIDEKEFIWSSWDWKSKIRPKLSEKDIVLLDSIHSQDSKIRKKAIELLGHQFPAFHLRENSTYLDVIYDLMNEMRHENFDLKYIGLKDNSLVSYSQDELKEFFGSNKNHLFNEMMSFEIHPNILFKFILSNLPRHFLLILSRDDPILENRKKCYEVLTRYEFWLSNISSDDIRFNGPYSSWINTIDRAIIAITFEDDYNTKIVLSKLIHKLIDYFIMLNSKEQELLYEKILSSNLQNNITKLSENNLSLPLFARLDSLLNGEMNIIYLPDDLKEIPEETSYILINKLTQNLENDTNVDSLKKIVYIGNDNLKFYLLDKLTSIIKTNQKNIILDNITILLQLLSEDNNIRIRSLSKLQLLKIS